MQALFQSVRRSSCGKSSGSLHSSRYLSSNSIFFIYLLYCAVFCLLCDIISGLHSNYTDKQVKSYMHMRVHTCTLTFIQTWLVLSVCPDCILESFPKQAQEHKVYLFYKWTLVAELKSLTPPIPKPITRHLSHDPPLNIPTINLNIIFQSSSALMKWLTTKIYDVCSKLVRGYQKKLV